MQVQKQIDHLLAQRASEWLEVLKNASEAERAAFADWLRESRLHVQEFLEIVAVDRELDRIDPNREEDVESLVQRIAPRVVPLPQRDVPRDRLAQWLPVNRWKGAMAVAASVVIIAVAVLALARYLGPSQKFVTSVGEQRTIELADASVVLLNADSEIKVQLDESERSVRLLHGEALFKVAHDARRPFRVHARAATVQAVGTQFNVYDRPEGTRVSVLDGRVRVTAARTDTTLELGAGEEALIALDGRVARDPKADPARSVAWQQRRLIFDNTPLEDMVREFNRYNRSVHIELDGVAPGSHHYDGIFDADDPGSLAELLMHDADLTVTKETGTIVIRGR